MSYERKNISFHGRNLKLTKKILLIIFFVLHRKIFSSESQLSPIVKSSLVEMTRIPV